MANHKSALKRIRQSEKRKLHNRYYVKTMRHALRDFRAIEDKKEAEERLPKMISCIDRLAQRGMIHKNKAANLKSKCTKRVATL
ncbi:MAG: 30S ribosomal protein S20 [Bacteroidales bacterium]|nr:30S ribosomal protein S20 [Bacteroidales bacterium]MBQ9311446.1 30S ribosomal protein S20 [Bacteroidales bacterium]